MRGEGGYAVAKAAMGCATQYLALELGEHGIRVNQAVLGWLDGPGVRFYLTMTAKQRGLTEQDVYDEIARATRWAVSRRTRPVPARSCSCCPAWHPR